jgi:hypothetical protein
MKLTTLETRTLHPEQDLLHFYTKGSVKDRNGTTGAGIRRKLFRFCLTCGQL